ncbi:hypothetical protein J542_1553 [Acinetobacter baumannii 299505]|nr:hypothetical protein J542_1553 [Acinetobacter baumannii 299505]
MNNIVLSKNLLKDKNIFLKTTQRIYKLKKAFVKNKHLEGH